MKVRGQHTNAWLSRWRQGTCPIHGRGLVERPQPADAANADDDDFDGDAEVAEQMVEVACTKDACTVVVAQWPGKNQWHSLWGWLEGPDDIHAALVKAGDIPPEGPRPGHQARMVRTGWPLGEGEDF